MRVGFIGVVYATCVSIFLLFPICKSYLAVTFSRHAKVNELPLVIWLIENVRRITGLAKYYFFL